MSGDSAEGAGAGYAPRVGRLTGTLMVVGGIIGSGIFLNPSIVARRVGSAELTMLAWSVGAVVAVLGAFIYAELGARLPRAGGGYVYLREGFGTLPAFLYGWALLLAIATGAAAAVAVTFGSYTAALLALPASTARPIALGSIVLLSLVNVAGVSPGAMTQNVFTVLKLAAIAALVATALSVAPLPDAGVPATLAGAAPPPARPLGLALGSALVPVLFAYGGWQQTNFVAEEMHDARRTLPRALLVGVAIVAVVYLLVNLAYLRALGVEGLAASSAPAADAMRARTGAAGARLISVGIAVSTFGFLDVVILVSPRVYQAMARDGLFFARFARLHPRWRTPVAAILAQGAWACVLVLSGTYGDLLDYVTVADWLFFGATAATLPILRSRDRREGERAAGFRAPAAPLLVIVFVLAAAYVVGSAAVAAPRNALLGLGLVALGIPAYAAWHRGAGPRRIRR